MAKPKKPRSPKPPKTVAAKSRQLKTPAYRSFRLTKKVKHPSGRLTGSFRLLLQVIRHLRGSWKIFAGLLLIYGGLSIVFVRGISSLGLEEIKADLEATEGEKTGRLGAATTLFGTLLTSFGTTSDEIAAIYQTILLIVVSLALIWLLRQSYGQKIPTSLRLRDTFYQGMSPLIPFLLVLAVIGLQLLPLFFGATMYDIVMSQGLAVSALEKVIWAALFFGLALLSLYMVTSSVFALYIVTLPNMTPLKALRSARRLVRHRRWEVMRKILFLSLILILVAAVVMLPLLMSAILLAEWVFFALTLMGLVVAHTYMYALYRELL